ncbi:MAG: hypothetical protein CVU89_10295 [Firmicutes bacterium HGW-Firmicutes-14]|nr:MAG: hypothetical protein CVU89_10295 [Firmicutes bacterium HGW-Firmicutes-14]
MKMPQYTRSGRKAAGTETGVKHTAVQVTEPVRGWGLEWKYAIQRVNNSIAWFVDELNGPGEDCHYTVHIDKEGRQIFCEIFNNEMTLIGKVTYKFNQFIGTLGKQAP